MKIVQVFFFLAPARSLSRWVSMWAPVALFFTLSFPAFADSADDTHQQHYAAWVNRLEQYRADFVRKDEQIRAKDADPQTWAIPAGGDQWQHLISKVFSLSAQVRDAFVIAGRGETVKAFAIHMENKPSPGLADNWFTQQTLSLKEQAAAVDSKTAQFFATIDQRLRQGPEWIRDIEQLAREQGVVLGKAKELELLHYEALSYYKDQYNANLADQEASNQRQQAAKNFLGALALIAGVNYQQQLINQLSHPTYQPPLLVNCFTQKIGTMLYTNCR